MGIPEDSIAFVDETGIDRYLCREHGYAPKGQPVFGRVRGRKYARVGVVAAQLGQDIIAPCHDNGTMNHEMFEDWFENHLLPALPEGAAIVMDNAAFHRKEQLYDYAQKHGHPLIFLPPYSPELNPIERFWSWLKRTMRRTLPLLRDVENPFDTALFAAFFFRRQLMHC